MIRMHSRGRCSKIRASTTVVLGAGLPASTQHGSNGPEADPHQASCRELAGSGGILPLRLPGGCLSGHARLHHGTRLLDSVSPMLSGTPTQFLFDGLTQVLWHRKLNGRRRRSRPERRPCALQAPEELPQPSHAAHRARGRRFAQWFCINEMVPHLVPLKPLQRLNARICRMATMPARHRTPSSAADSELAWRPAELPHATAVAVLANTAVAALRC